MNKLQALQELLTRVQDRERLASNSYFRFNDDGKKCHCAVGHLLDIGGASFTPFINNPVLNWENIDNLARREPEIFKTLTDLGFTPQELNTLQAYNDLKLLGKLETFIKSLIVESGGTVNE